MLTGKTVESDRLEEHQNIKIVQNEFDCLLFPVFHYAEEAIDFAKNNIIIAAIAFIILLILVCAVGVLVRKVVRRLSEARERALSKFKALMNSKEAVELPEAVPDMEVSHVQPAHAKKKLVRPNVLLLPPPATCFLVIPLLKSHCPSDLLLLLMLQ